MRQLLAPAFLIAVVAGSLGLALCAIEFGPIGPPRVKLAVLVVFDQMRGDYPTRWKPLYGPDGFQRIQKDGMSFTHCFYPYGTTTTGPGHASILSGTCGDKHGIVNNSWYEGGRSAYCAGSADYQFVTGSGGAVSKAGEVGNPDRMLAPTVADALKKQRPGSKVFGLSLKDRSAILPTGKNPDGAYWFQGQFVTSTYYTDRGHPFHPWVEKFNKSKAADAWFGKDWTHFRPDVDYVKWSGPDIAPGEGAGVNVKVGNKTWAQGVAFPHPNTGGRDKPGKEYYEALANSPFGNDLLLQFAKECIVAEHLGEDDVPDLLVVSFSSNDLIGHTWGPDSQEVMDVTLRSDVLIGELLKFLDAKVGPGQYLVGITADHGICPLPEASRGRGLDAKRVDPAEIVKALDAHLNATFSDEKKLGWMESTAFPWIYLNPKAIAEAKKTREEVAEAATAFLRSQPDIARAFTRRDLQAKSAIDDVIAARARRSFYPARNGDIYVVLKEWYLPTSAKSTGTTHGAPYDYDAHVPLMLYGPGIQGGEQTAQTTPQAMATIFSKWLGIRPPKKAEFPIPSVLKDK